MAHPASSFGLRAVAARIGIRPLAIPGLGPLFGITLTLGASKVVLSTVGVTLFVAERGTAGLPGFYVGFAPFAILLSLGLGSVIDRMPRARLAQLVFAAVLLGALGLRLLPAGAGIGQSGWLLLGVATAFEMVLEILFWTLAASCLLGFAFRQATPLLYLGLAAGAAAGGLVARLGVEIAAPADLLFLLAPLTLLLMLQLQALRGRHEETTRGAPHAARPTADDRGVAALPRLLRRHPLALLIALSSIVVTILYVLSEFLVLGLYERRFTSEAELAALLATVFAAMQIIEAVLLLTLSRRLLERTGPLFRNLVFPLTSLATLVHLAFNPRLAAAILVQINNDAICNAVFLPVHTANYLAVPAAMQGRIRTLAEGICYPLGLALAGLMLMWMGASTGTAAVQFSAITLALALLLLGTAIGSLFLPALLDTGEVGVLPLARTGKKPLLLPAETADRVRTLLRAAEAEPSLMGIQLCRGLDLDRFTAELVDLAARADPEIRRELVALAHDAPWAWAGAFLWACAERGGGAALVALEGLLARQAEADPALLARLRQTGDAEVQAIAGWLDRATGPGRADTLASLVRRSDVASSLLEAIMRSRRKDLGDVLEACWQAAQLDQRRGALMRLADSADDLPASWTRMLERARHDPDPRTRAAALRAMGRLPEDAATSVPGLIDALSDPAPLVRRSAANALVGYGDRVVLALGPPSAGTGPRSCEAGRVLARIGSAGARRMLRIRLRHLRSQATQVAELDSLLREGSRSARHLPLELCLADYAVRLGDFATAVLTASLSPDAAARVRHAVGSPEHDERAWALEILAATPEARWASDAVAVLRLHTAVLPPNRATAGPAPSQADDAWFALANGIEDRWVRLAARSLDAARQRPTSRNAGMPFDDLDLQRVLLLKRSAPFARLPLDTLERLARGARLRTRAAGEQLAEGQELNACCHLVEAGTLALIDPGGVRIVAAPTLFNETALFGEPAAWRTAVALAPARVLSIQGRLFQALCLDHPELAIDLGQHLARRLRTADDPVHGSRPIRLAGTRAG